MSKFRRATILLAEDNPDDLEITRRAFERSRLTSDLVVLRDGRAVLDYLNRREEAGIPLPDFIILDINLPRVNGLAVLTSIRADKRFAAIPVVVMSASSRDEDVRRSYLLGANSFIQKPVAFQEFLKAVGVLWQYWFEVAQIPAAEETGGKL